MNGGPKKGAKSRAKDESAEKAGAQRASAEKAGAHAECARRSGAEMFPLGSLETFADECDRTRSAAAAGRLLALTARKHGFDKVILASHNHPAQVGSFAVCVHNCDADAIEHFLGQPNGAANVIFQAAIRSNEPVRWDEPELRARASQAQRRWLDALPGLGLRNGTTQRIRTALAPASCSLTPAHEGLSEEAMRWMMWAGAYVFHHVIMLQRPRLAPSAVLTFREHQCLALASLAGMRPREVAAALGVSVNTVRTNRQRACARLGARSQEEAIWRMVETGQLFLPGRVNKPKRG